MNRYFKIYVIDENVVIHQNRYICLNAVASSFYSKPKIKID